MAWKFRDRTLIDPVSGRTDTVAVASPVQWGHVPRWLKQRLAPHHLDLCCYTTTHLLLNGAEWLDHWGSTDEGKAFVAEPYHLTGDGMRSLIHFAEVLDLHMFVTAASDYYVTHTLRITLTPRNREVGS